MARNVQLLSLLAKLRAETGRSQSISIGIDEADNFKEMLRRTQEELYEEWEWPHLRIQRSVSLNAGQRYYDLPSDLNFDKIEDVALQYNEVYQRMERGIDFTDYTAFDSNAATPERSSPVLKWDIRHTGSTEQLEVWPIPNDDIQTIYFFGTKKLGDLIQDSDTADLDDRLIVLFTATEILAEQDSARAQIVSEKANRRLLKLRANSVKKRRVSQIGLGKWKQNQRSGIKIIVS